MHEFPCATLEELADAIAKVAVTFVGVFPQLGITNRGRNGYVLTVVTGQ